MVKDSLIFKIFIRFLKEKNIFYVFKKQINNTYFMNLDSIINIHICNLHSLALFNTNYENKLYNFLSSKKNVDEFTNIVSFYTKKYVYKFLEEEKIKHKFAINLYKLNYINKDIGIKSFKASKHEDKLINIYIDECLKGNNVLASNFFFSAFSWGDTAQGYGYWSDLNIKYKKFMLHNLLNK